MPKLKKTLLEIRLSIHVRNFAAPNEPLKIVIKFLYFNPKVAETLWSKNHENPSDRKSHTWAPLNYSAPSTNANSATSITIAIHVRNNLSATPATNATKAEYSTGPAKSKVNYLLFMRVLHHG